MYPHHIFQRRKKWNSKCSFFARGQNMQKGWIFFPISSSPTLLSSLLRTMTNDGWLHVHSSALAPFFAKHRSRCFPLSLSLSLSLPLSFSLSLFHAVSSWVADAETYNAYGFSQLYIADRVSHFSPVSTLDFLSCMMKWGSHTLMYIQVTCINNWIKLLCNSDPNRILLSQPDEKKNLKSNTEIIDFYWLVCCGLQSWEFVQDNFILW